MVSSRRLASIMLELQVLGCHNINFVTPSHVVPQILVALEMTTAKGLVIPLVFHSGGYDRVKTLKLLEGVFDIYIPDFKFWTSDTSHQLCGAPDYPKVVKRALREMYRQVGNLHMNDQGIAQRCILIRHLVMPRQVAETCRILRFISQEISKETHVNIMGQYRPCGRAGEIKGVSVFPGKDEVLDALKAARDEGLSRIDQSS